MKHMETRTVYFNSQKSLWKLILGIGMIVSIFFFERFTIWVFVYFITAGSFIFFALKSFSKKPQLIFSSEGLFIGFKLKRIIPWKSIERILIKESTVDFRKMSFIEITSRIKTSAPSNKLVREFPIDDLKIGKHELQALIDDYLSNKSKPDGVPGAMK
jgi:hypothetical protein